MSILNCNVGRKQTHIKEASSEQERKEFNGDVLFQFFLQGREYFSCAFLTGPNTVVPASSVRSWSRIPLCMPYSIQWRDRVPHPSLFFGDVLRP